MSSAASTAETDRFEQSMTHFHAGGYALELRDLRKSFGKT